ncbi:translation initiation factor IF-2 [Streptomyces sp. M2CJ-2]|uniref:translation initiation factor IF-2 n=1 Tax=Streptomyces sp. M2CJ-2 TaxID=2803948 RepID=UPI00192621A6|nr:translation initiation factor IF-2 [Streptomyces sp. M2CJ-2]MBL3666793.1 translation initiation factor IF-2 [Streptomyces sp. M2CJ-2]
MPGKGPGGGTSFEDMSHEQMLAWLDKANAGTVQAAADRLIAAAKEIHKIAEDLKVRPQWVEWKGEGADAFRTWSGDLANSTLRLGDFSEHAAKWLAETSGAIAQAQASIPRDAGSAQANLDAARAARNDPDAARAARNDPDAAAVGAKSASELAALAANKEEVRQQAAAQMWKLGQTYAWSATRLNALERPKFPPPPEAFVPDDSHAFRGATAEARAGGSPAGTSSSGAVSFANPAHAREGSSSAPDLRQSSGAALSERDVQVDVEQPTRMGIDSVAVLPHSPPSPTTAAGDLPGPEQVKGGTTPQTGMIPSVFDRGGGAPVNNQAGQGRAPGVGHAPFLPGQGSVSNPVRMPPGATGSSGIVGGRSVTPPAGRPTGAIPRGVVVGGEGVATPRGPVGPTAGPTSPVGRATGQQGQAPGRRPAVSNRGIVGGRPLPNDGAGSGLPQQSGRTGAVLSGPGSPGAPAGSGTAGRGIVGGASSATRQGGGRGVSGTRASRSAPAANTGSSRGRPYGAAKDEETRRQGGLRAVPPVID